MLNKVNNIVFKNLKVFLAISVIIALIFTSIKLSYNTGYLVGFLILFIILIQDYLQKIIFELRVKKIFGIEFEESQRANMKEGIREEVLKQGIDLSPNQIDTISDVVLNQISGIAHKSKYYEELVLYALKDLGVLYNHKFSGAVGKDKFLLDFVVELEGSSVLGIEAVYSNQQFLSKDKIDRIIRASNTFKKADDLKGIAIVTNAEVRPRDKELLSSQNPQIEVLENVISPDGILSALEMFINKFRMK